MLNTTDNHYRIQKAIFSLVLVAVFGVVGIFAAARMWPLPSGQGFAYVAHTFFALVGAGTAATGTLIACLVRPGPFLWWMFGGLSATWAFTAAIFLSA